MSEVTTALAVEAIAWGRAPKCLYTDGRESWVNRRVVCADGFKVSLQASNGVWAWVPRGVAADLLEAHGGAVGWEEPRRDDNEHGGASRPEQADHE